MTLPATQGVWDGHSQEGTQLSLVASCPDGRLKVPLWMVWEFSGQLLLEIFSALGRPNALGHGEGNICVSWELFSKCYPSALLLSQ